MAAVNSSFVPGNVRQLQHKRKTRVKLNGQATKSFIGARSHALYCAVGGDQCKNALELQPMKSSHTCAHRIHTVCG